MALWTTRASTCLYRLTLIYLWATHFRPKQLSAVNSNVRWLPIVRWKRVRELRSLRLHRVPATRSVHRVPRLPLSLRLNPKPTIPNNSLRLAISNLLQALHLSPAAATRRREDRHTDPDRNRRPRHNQLPPNQPNQRWLSDGRLGIFGAYCGREYWCRHLFALCCGDALLSLLC